MGIQGNDNSIFTCYLKVVLDRIFENLESILDYSISHYFREVEDHTFIESNYLNKKYNQQKL